MKRKRLLDSFALLAYLNKEKDFRRIRDWLSEAQQSGESVLMNEMNIGEVYYIIYRKRGKEHAEYFLETILVALPITVISNTLEDVIDAAKIKAEYPVSFADCFVAATAQREDAVILTGDPEFKRLEQLVTIEWLGSEKKSKRDS